MRGSAITGMALAVLITLGTGAMAAPVEAPSYTKGDYWRYTLWGNSTVPAGAAFGDIPIGIRGNRTVWVTDVTSSGETRIELSNAKAKGTAHLQAQTVRIAMDLTTNTTDDGRITRGHLYFNLSADAGFISIHLGAQGTTKSTVQEDTFTFPIDAGRRARTVEAFEAHGNWTQTFPGVPTPPIDVAGTSTTEYMVGQSQEITVPAGKFTASAIDSWTNSSVQGNAGQIPFLLSAGSGNRTRTYYSRDVGGAVRIDSFNAQGVSVAQENLAGYQYASGTNGLLRVLSQPTSIAAIAGAAAVLVVVSVMALRRRRRRAPSMLPPWAIPPPGMEGTLAPSPVEPQAPEVPPPPPEERPPL